MTRLQACIIIVVHQCTMFIVHACTMVIVHTCTMIRLLAHTIIKVHACTMSIVHACTLTKAHACPTIKVHVCMIIVHACTKIIVHAWCYDHGTCIMSYRAHVRRNSSRELRGAKPSGKQWRFEGRQAPQCSSFAISSNPRHPPPSRYTSAQNQRSSLLADWLGRDTDINFNIRSSRRFHV